jgi:hypothetical protein
MFVENYRLDTMIGGQAQTTTIPYPKISDEDWHAWKAFLPVKSAPFSKKVLRRETKTSLRTAYDIPSDVYYGMVRAAGYFEDIEVWRMREIQKTQLQ